jgi:hypothetical protein
MKILLFFISTILLLSSCSSLRSSNSNDLSKNGMEKSNPDQLDLTFDPLNKEKPLAVVPLEETVRVGDHGGDTFSNSDLRETQVRVENRKLRIGLSLGPGMYRTINYVSLLKILERQNLTPSVITGTGFGAIVAAMYATGMTPESIEWSFYKYFKEKNKNKLYDSDWVSEIDETFLTKFKSMNIQETKRKFFITLYDHTTRKTYYFDKGNIRTLLLLNLKLSSNLDESNGGQKYSAAFEKEVFNARLLRQVGAEFTISVDSLGTKFDFENSNEFLIGIYGKIAGRIQKERKDFDYNINLPLNSMNLDSTKDGPLYLQRTYDYMQKQAPLIFKKIQAKSLSLSNSGNE